MHLSRASLASKALPFPFPRGQGQTGLMEEQRSQNKTEQ